MENDSAFAQKLRELGTSIMDFLNEQEWYQQLKSKWEELDPLSRTYLKFAGVGGTVLLFFIFVLSSIWSVHSLKSEMNDKLDLLNQIQSANDELKRLKETLPPSALASLAPTAPGAPAAPGSSGTSGTSADWQAYFETTAGNAGVDKSVLTVASGSTGASKETKSSTELAEEAMFDITLKHVNIKQVVRLAFFLENGPKPVKLRNLLIDTGNDPSGYMDATLAVSGFTLIPPK